MHNTLRHIIGYAAGAVLFLFLIPRWLYSISSAEYAGFEDEIFSSSLLRYILSLPVFLAGLVFAAWSNYYLNAVGKGGPVDAFNIPLSPRSKVLLTGGPYRYTRNPMVFGAVCLYASIGLYLNSLRCLIVVAGFLLFLIIYVKVFEEPRLRRDFGREYEEYRRRVSMIVPFRRRKG